MRTIKSFIKNGIKKGVFLWSVNWIKTIYFNFKMFPFSVAKKLPVYFYGSVKFSNLSGKIRIEGDIKSAMVGFGQSYEKSTRSRGISELHLAGTLLFKGHVQLGKDYLLYIHKNAYCEFGHLASIASNSKVICYEKIILKTHARLGSEAQIIDTNFHRLINTKTLEKHALTAPIVLGSYNFISNRVTILQKTKTPDFCIIASNTLCTKDYTALGPNCLIGGVPAQLLKENISRDWDSEKELMQSLILF